MAAPYGTGGLGTAPADKKAAKRASLLRGRARARAYVDELRARTPCAHCGVPMADWHNPEHVSQPTRRVALLVGAGRSLTTIAAEIAVCTPLCRKCHMAEDGRLKNPPPSSPPGEQNPNAKLTRDQVLAIRERMATLQAERQRRGLRHVPRGSLSALAAEFGVRPNYLIRIANGEAWVSVQGAAA